MGLVNYSDSEESETEQVPSPKPKANTNKTRFEKVVDRSNPGKIRVNLPTSTQADGKDESGPTDEPPTKRARLGGSSFNSFLPAPKRSAPAGTLANGSGQKRGLGSGVSLKTGATPGFSREPEPEYDAYEESIDGAEFRPDGGDISQTTPDLSTPPPEQKDRSTGLPDVQTDTEPAQKPMMFKPLSVTAKKKKKKAAPQAAQAEPFQSTNTIPASIKPAAKVSLFSMGGNDSSDLPINSNEDYKPMMYDSTAAAEFEPGSSSALTDPVYQSEQAPQEYPPIPTAQDTKSLDFIASDLNLSESAKRQLFGRQRGSKSQLSTASAVKVINFNTDQEYAANETERLTGETAVNAVRSVAPGKHSLKQLVSMASGQKDALEESFASGRRNKAEAGSRYGW
jgi:hypothetical protein